MKSHLKINQFSSNKAIYSQVILNNKVISSNKESLFNQHKIKLIKKKSFKNNYDLIVVCVPHKSIKKFSIKFLKSICDNNCSIFDIKGIFPRKDVTWQL